MEEGNLHKGVFGAIEDSWGGPSGQDRAFESITIQVDTPEALEKAIAESGEYLKKPGDKPPVDLSAPLDSALSRAGVAGTVGDFGRGRETLGYHRRELGQISGPGMNPQQMADFFARLAKPRLMELLKLQNVEFLYDATPGRAPGTYFHQGREVPLKLQKTSQPYKDLYRFVEPGEGSAIYSGPRPGAAVKAIKTDVRGRSILMTPQGGSQRRSRERAGGPPGWLWNADPVAARP